jgi:hypothetical protein
MEYVEEIDTRDGRLCSHVEDGTGREGLLHFGKDHRSGDYQSSARGYELRKSLFRASGCLPEPGTRTTVCLSEGFWTRGLLGPHINLVMVW